MKTSDVVMNGDKIKTGGEIYTVEIQGRNGSYVTLNGKYTNIAIGKEGFLKAEGKPAFRAEWSRVEIVERACPDLFTEDGLNLKNGFAGKHWEK